MARRLYLPVIAIVICLTPLPAAAQRGAEVFGFILDQAGREMQRQEQRQRDRQQRQYLQRLHQQFVAQWHACHQDDLGACDQALAYPYLEYNNRTRLIAKRAQIVSAQHDRLEAELQRRREDELRSERLRREQERKEQRLAELRAYARQHDACRRYDLDACDRALNFAHASGVDQNDLRTWRATAERYRADRNLCQSGSLAACDAALASTAVIHADRRALEAWRTAAHPFNQALAALAGLPTSTYVAGGFALVLALALAAVAYRRRPADPAGRANAPAPEALFDTEPATDTPAVNEARAASWRPRPADGLGGRSAPSAVPPKPAASAPTGPPPLPEARDTPGAIAAMELAQAYIDEVGEAERPGLEDRDLRKLHLNTLALAAKQLDLAQRSDRDAILEVVAENDAILPFTIAELKAQALVLEGLTHQTYDTKRAVPALRQATALDPDNPSAHYVLGLVQAANMNRAEAIASLQRAVDLDPKNLTYRKELNRAQSLTGAEIAAYKATRAGEHLYDAGIKTANAGILAWNIFAVTWNILTFPLRLMFSLLRMLRVM